MTETKSPIDLDFLSEISGGDMGLEREILGTFLVSHRKDLSKLEQALKDNDAYTWCTVAHSLKGASASIGAINLAELFEHAQTHQNETPSQKQKLMEQIKAELELVIQLISERNPESKTS